MTFTAAQIAEKLRGEVLGDGSVALTGFASADCAKPGDLTFAEKETYFAAAEQSQATAILISGSFTSATKILIRVPDARVAVAKLLPIFFFRRTNKLREFIPVQISPHPRRLIPQRTSDRIV